MSRPSSDTWLNSMSTGDENVGCFGGTRGGGLVSVGEASLGFRSTGLCSVLGAGLGLGRGLYVVGGTTSGFDSTVVGLVLGVAT